MIEPPAGQSYTWSDRRRGLRECRIHKRSLEVLGFYENRGEVA